MDMVGDALRIVTYLITSFWENELTSSDISRLAALVRAHFDCGSSPLSDAELIASLRFEDLDLTPWMSQMLRQGTYLDHPLGASFLKYAPEVFRATISDFWDNELDQDVMRCFVAIVRGHFDCGDAADALSDAEFVAKIRTNPYTGEDFEDVVCPRVLEMLYRGTHTSHVLGASLADLAEGARFGGMPPEGHPLPDMFSGTGLHVSVPAPFEGCTFRLSLPPDRIKEEFGYDDCEAFFLRLLAEGDDAELFVNGERTPPPAGAVESLKVQLRMPVTPHERAAASWHALRKLARVIPIALFWQCETQTRLCAIDGEGRKRDRSMFEEECEELLSGR